MAKPTIDQLRPNVSINAISHDIQHDLAEIQAIAHRKNNPAGYIYERLLKIIESHQKNLADDFELGIHVIGGAAPAFHLRELRCSNPDLLIFMGQEADGNVVQLVQHFSQMSVAIRAIPKLAQQAYRIGFTAK